MRVAAVAAALSLIALAHDARAQDPQPGTPERTAQHLDNHQRARARTLDYATNPDYQQRVAPLVVDYAAGRGPTFERVTVDPFLAGVGA